MIKFTKYFFTVVLFFIFTPNLATAIDSSQFKHFKFHHKCERDKGAILELYAVTDAAFADGDLETWADFYTDDVVAFYPGVPLIRGKEAVIESVAPLFTDPNVSITVTPEVIEIARRCDQAVAYGKGVTRIFDPVSGQYFVEYTKWMTLLKKQMDGSWKASADIFNSDGALAPEE